jgi:hypothetical protein
MAICAGRPPSLNDPITIVLNSERAPSGLLMTISGKSRADERPLCAAGSTGRCNTFRELVCWGLIEQGLSGPFIELPCYRAEFGLAM